MLRLINNTQSLKYLARQYPWLPWMFFRVYLYPALALKTSGRLQMNSKKFFDNHYASDAVGVGSVTLKHSDTISKEYDEMHAHLHYNSVSGSILRVLANIGSFPRTSLLDIGSGTGYWIDFYQGLFPGIRCIGTDISDPAVNFMKAKYSRNDSVEIRQCDVSKDTLNHTNIDIVNAIGVMFHIIDDEDLKGILATLKAVLSKDGLFFVGGHFGLVTRDIMFQRDGDRLSVTKRIRSSRWWKRIAREVGLEVVQIERTQNPRGYLFPENNILVMKHAQ